jgi:hypothetical protein
MLTHLGYPELGQKVDMALEVCSQYERKIKITGRDTGCTGEEYGQYVLDTVADPDLEPKWKSYAGA